MTKARPSYARSMVGGEPCGCFGPSKPGVGARITRAHLRSGLCRCRQSRPHSQPFRLKPSSIFEQTPSLDWPFCQVVPSRLLRKTPSSRNRSKPHERQSSRHSSAQRRDAHRCFPASGAVAEIKPASPALAQAATSSRRPQLIRADWSRPP
jgi:hypothetical protein